MLEFLFRLVVQTVKFAFRLLMIVGGLLLPALVKAGISVVASSDDEPADEAMATPVSCANTAFANGEIDGFGLRAYRDMNGE
ncbi:hypothetical protein C8245_18425 [Paracidovorax avenae]|uniref:hypothetical protein n=1 Tax=Paracidovorax avenae TaxID=80867 RepID=UPI000D220DB9|nr:hypothetical protein [Paracidovorax avenae]AVS67393.1 hypothetical protein C8245_18425 [Paracidovorax avenae]